MTDLPAVDSEVLSPDALDQCMEQVCNADSEPHVRICRRFANRSIYIAD